MDVAILATARFPIAQPFAGGMEAHTHALAEGLSRRGHAVTVYAAGGEGRFRVRPMVPLDFQPSERARGDVASAPHDVVAEHHSYLEAILELGASSHDLVHVNAVHHLPFACAHLLSAVVTATLHSPPTPWLESALALAGGRGPRLASVSSTNAAAWTSPARPGATEPGDHRAIDVDRVIGNGVDLDTWRPGRGGHGAAWAGRLVPEKAPHLAIDACREAGVPIRLIGPAHDPSYFRAEVAPRLGPDAAYLGHGTVAEVVELFGSSDVAVVTPTWDEPFGLVVIEAMACGTPVAGLARGALSELVDGTVGGLATDPAGLPAAVTAAMHCDRRRCRQRAEQRHSLAAMVDAYERWFTELLAA